MHVITHLIAYSECVRNTLPLSREHQMKADSERCYFIRSTCDKIKLTVENQNSCNNDNSNDGCNHV